MPSRFGFGELRSVGLFAPEVRTDENGQASIAVTLPDNLTRYRVMVVAVAGGKFFGTGESSLTARLPLMVRPSAPRFLNFGDSFELPVVLQNQTDEAMETHVVVRATNAEVMAEGGENGATGYAVTVPANDRVEVRFPTTTAGAGTARFQFGAIDANQPSIADAAEVDLPVYTPATTEAFAVYGEIDESGAVMQPLRPPSAALPNYGGLEVTISSTALQALTDAFIYLVRYPYECSEQLASRILGVSALRDVLTAFEAEGLPSPAEIESTMERDLQTLAALQDDSGGFPIWRRGWRSLALSQRACGPCAGPRPAEGLRRARRDAEQFAGLPAPYRGSLPELVRGRRPPGTFLLCAVCAQVAEGR